MQGYDRCPRSLAERAEAYLKSTGIADAAYFGPENEFFVFDTCAGTTTCRARSTRSIRTRAPGTRTQYRGRQHRPPPERKGRLLPGSAGRLAARHSLGHVPRDRGTGRRDRSASPRGRNGRPVRNRYAIQHAGAQGRRSADPEVRVHNVAHAYGKTATFMPKPLVGDNGNGMHVHQSLFKDGEEPVLRRRLRRPVRNGAVLHRRRHQARESDQCVHQPGTNSYKRLVPGFEAPTMLAYSARNRSASIRIPYIANPKGRRIEVRFPDSTANPYLAFAR